MPTAPAAAKRPCTRRRRREAIGAASFGDSTRPTGIGRNGDAAAMDTPQAGHDPADRAQQRRQAWMPHARQVDRPRRRRLAAGRAGEPQCSQKRSSALSADEAAQGSIIARGLADRSSGTRRTASPRRRFGRVLRVPPGTRCAGRTVHACTVLHRERSALNERSSVARETGFERADAMSVRVPITGPVSVGWTSAPDPESGLAAWPLAERR